MKCAQTTEFISALCDGETIPRAAAEHIGQCEVCRDRLKDYSEFGAELRRVASLESMDETQVRNWGKTERTVQSWWSRGWEAMRIPRLVFASLLLVIVVLSSTLAILKARAQTEGAVLMLTAKTADGGTTRCALSLDHKNSASCTWMTVDRAYGLGVLATNGGRVELGVRTGVTAEFTSASGLFRREDFEKLPAKQYWFQPGETLEVDIPDAGTMVVTGELMDHMPALALSPSEQMDPKPDELRFVSPVLLSGTEVVCDLQGATAIVTKKGHGIELYAPGEGLFHISLSPLQGAVEGRITVSRVSFQLDGQSYKFLLAAPVARGEHIWILRDASYKPSGEAWQHGFIGDRDESDLLANPQ